MGCSIFWPPQKSCLSPITNTWYSFGSQRLSGRHRASSLPSLQSRRPSQTRDLEDREDKRCERHNGPMGGHHNWRYLMANNNRWRHMHLSEMQPPKGATCIRKKLATRWHHLNYLEIWPPGGATCICKKFGHQVASLVLVRNLATRWRHLH